MGYTVLYIAFGVVALWLLAEVLYQHKARLRWRLLAFTGFLGVALGVAASVVLLIIAGALAFGAGQTLVTLSHRKGFAAGWALGARPGSNRRRRTENAGAGPSPAGPPYGPHHDVDPFAGEPDTATTAVHEPFGAAPGDPFAPADPYADAGHGAEPTGGDGAFGDHPEPVRGTDAHGPYAQAAYGSTAYGDDGQNAVPVYSPSPLPDETGEYGVYGDNDPYAAQPYAAAHQDPSAYGTGGYGADGYGNPWPVAPEDDVFANGAPSAAPSHDPGQWSQGQAAQTGQDPYAADPYAAAYPADPYAATGYAADPYAQQGYAPQDATQGGQGAYGYGQYDYGQQAYGQPAYQQPDAYGNGYAQDPYQQPPQAYDPAAWNGGQDATPPHFPQQDATAHDAGNGNGNPDDPYRQHQGYTY